MTRSSEGRVFGVGDGGENSFEKRETETYSLLLPPEPIGTDAEPFPPNRRQAYQSSSSSRRRSTLLMLRGTVADLAKSIPDFSKAVKETLRRNHAYTTMALCMCIITHCYLYMNPFTYGGFMAVRLCEGLSVDNAGRATGIMLSSYMLGKAITAYGWGRIADVYGRKFTLLLSLGLCSIFSAWFGFSKSWTWVVITRFLGGCCNGINNVVFAMVTEISHGDAELETRGVGVVLGRYSWGLMVAPAFGGILAEPFRQFPILNKLFPPTSDLYKAMSSMPFALPNMVGTLLCWCSMALLQLAAEETLSSDRIRSWKCFVSDGGVFFVEHTQRFFGFVCSGIEGARQELHRRFLSGSATERNNIDNIPVASDVRSVEDTTNHEENGETTTEEIMSENDQQQLLEEDLNNISQFPYDIASPILANVNCRQSFATTIRRQSFALTSAHPIESNSHHIHSRRELLRHYGTSRSLLLPTIPSEEFLLGPLEAEEKEEIPVLKYFLTHPQCRRHMIIYWMASFTGGAVDAAFPLYCMSNVGGLGVDEVHIGAVQTLSGTIFNFVQYAAFAYLIQTLGFRGTMVTSIFLSFLILTFFPLSLRLNGNAMEGELTPQAFVFLVALMTLLRTLTSSFAAALVVSMNRTMAPQQRAAMNGFSHMVGSITRGLGPLLAGYLVYMSYTHLPPRQGSWMIWFSISATGFLGFAILKFLTTSTLAEYVLEEV